MTTVPLRGAVDTRFAVVHPEAMDCTVDHYSIPALDAGAPETVDSSTIDSHEIRLTGGEVLISRLNPRKSRVHHIPSNLVRYSVASTEFVPLRPTSINAGYLAYLLESEHTRQTLGSLVRSATRSHQRVDPEEILRTEIPVQDQAKQRHIADFLDERVALIDKTIGFKAHSRATIEAQATRKSFECVTGQHRQDRRPSGLDWVASLPEAWPVLTVGSQFRVDLGKMLNERNQVGTHAIPYLRNTNVQWDNVDTSDLKHMDISPNEREQLIPIEGVVEV